MWTQIPFKTYPQRKPFIYMYKTPLKPDPLLSRDGLISSHSQSPACSNWTQKFLNRRSFFYQSHEGYFIPFPPGANDILHKIDQNNLHKRVAFATVEEISSENSSLLMYCDDVFLLYFISSRKWYFDLSM